jgi:hypothetical protein
MQSNGATGTWSSSSASTKQGNRSLKQDSTRLRLPLDLGQLPLPPTKAALTRLAWLQNVVDRTI